MKINRLTEIILILLNKKNITAKELADKFQVSIRTIYRDIETLSSSGVPVYMNKGKGGGIFLLEDFSINKAILSENDKHSLTLALKALSSIQYPEVNSIINKVGFIKNKNNEEEWIDIDLSRWGSKLRKDDKFTKVKDAILNNQLIEFTYVNSLANKSIRKVEPSKLIYKGQSWYLYGYCRLKKDFRLFKISRIKDLILKEEVFEKRSIDSIESNMMEQNVENIVKLKLKVKREALYRLFDDFDEESIIDNNDGTYEVNIEFPENDWLYGYILSFGPYVEVLEPAHIRNIVLQRMKETIKIYSKI
ncbi:helix-turn-helix transcriptional regulator [Terrisporobacter sp.]|uniref:helix-turn-helix transcriptional regulator n=1 Tax=Terrisporobacter sp. TaxID=1965305 RepID=UPI00260AA124|nr:YafY family protein [Terrisporobacter sp.]